MPLEKRAAAFFKDPVVGITEEAMESDNARNNEVVSLLGCILDELRKLNVIMSENSDLELDSGDY